MPSIKQRQACCRPGDSVLIFFTQHPSFFAPLAYFPRVLFHFMHFEEVGRVGVEPTVFLM